MKKILVVPALCLFGIFQVAGCGSGSTVTLPQQKTATIIFSASTSAALPTAVRSVAISAKIPAGVTVPLKVNSNREVDPAALIAYKSGSAVLGRYSAPLLTVTVIGDVTPSSSGLGRDNVRDFAGVLLSFPVGLPLTSTSFTSINNPPGFAATGYTGVPPNSTSVDLTGFLTPTMRVTF